MLILYVSPKFKYYKVKDVEKISLNSLHAKRRVRRKLWEDINVFSHPINERHLNN